MWSSNWNRTSSSQDYHKSNRVCISSDGKCSVCGHLFKFVPSLVPSVSIPRFVSTSSYTSPVTRHRTPWLLSPSTPLLYLHLPAAQTEQGHSMPLMQPWPHVRPKWEPWVPAPPPMIDSRDALLSQPLPPPPPQPQRTA